MYSILEDSVPIHPGGTDDSTSGMKYVFCPECGRQISRSGRGTRSEQPCPKCGADLGIEVDAAGKVLVLCDWQSLILTLVRPHRLSDSPPLPTLCFGGR